MKYIANSLLIAGAIMGAGSASAMGLGDFGFDNVSPYIGGEYEWSSMKGANTNPSIRGLSYRNLVSNSYSGGNIFLGGRWCNFATEIGYDFTGTKKKHLGANSHNIAGLNANFDHALVLGDRFESKVRLSGWHVDFNGYMPLCDCWELIGSVGYGWMKAKTSITSVYTGRNIGSLTRRGLHAHSSYKGMFRLGVGAQYMVTECVGLRGMLRWKNTEKLHVSVRNNDPLASRSVSMKPFKDTISLSAGVFVKF